MSLSLSRREFLALSATATASAFAQSTPAKGTLYAYVSSWTSGANGAGGDGGIYVFRVNEQTAELTPLGHVAPELNAGYICIAPDGSRLYSTDERKDFGGRPGVGGGVVSFSIDRATGQLTRQKSALSMGAFPAYISIDRTGEFVAVANHASYDSFILVEGSGPTAHLRNGYDDASTALLSTKDGELGVTDIAVCPRNPIAGRTYESPRERQFQTSAHAHSVNWDPSNNFVLTCDKGMDFVHVNKVNRNASTLELVESFRMPTGTAPRHSAFHPTLPFVYIVHELKTSLTVLRFGSDGHLTAVQTIDTVKPSADKSIAMLPADIHVHPSGKFVYASNRGDNSIAAYTVDPKAGTLTLVDVYPLGGESPRGFRIEPEGRFLFAGAQNSNFVAAYRIDSRTGALSRLEQTTPVPRPVCLKFVRL